MELCGAGARTEQALSAMGPLLINLTLFKSRSEARPQLSLQAVMNPAQFSVP
jgi:hypothetical protein